MASGKTVLFIGNLFCHRFLEEKSLHFQSKQLNATFDCQVRMSEWCRSIKKTPSRGQGGLKGFKIKVAL